MTKSVRHLISFKDGRVDTIDDRASKIVLRKDRDRNMLDYIQGIPRFRSENGVRTFTRKSTEDEWSEDGSSVIRKTMQVRKLINDLYKFDWYIRDINDEEFAPDELASTLYRRPMEIIYKLTETSGETVRNVLWSTDIEADVKTIYDMIVNIILKNPMDPVTVKMSNLHTLEFRFN